MIPGPEDSHFVFASEGSNLPPHDWQRHDAAIACVLNLGKSINISIWPLLLISVVMIEACSLKLCLGFRIVLMEGKAKHAGES